MTIDIDLFEIDVKAGKNWLYKVRRDGRRRRARVKIKTSPPTPSAGSQETTALESAPPVAKPAKAGFTGEITDSLGRKRKFVNGKPVKAADDEASHAAPIAKFNGEEAHIVGRDQRHGLVRIKTASGPKVVKATDLKFEDAPPPASQPSVASSLKGAAKATHDYVHDKVAAGFAKLPAPVQSAVSTALKVAFAGWSASQKIAERISIEKGSTPEQAAQTRSALAAMDVVAFKPVAMATAPLGGAVAAATWLVPPVTAIYLAHSAVAHPLATYRAAKGIIREVSKAAKEFVDQHTDVMQESQEEDRQAVLDALENHGWSDWFSALLHAAMERTEDVGRAVGLAARAMKESPKDKSAPNVDDAEALFAKDA